MTSGVICLKRILYCTILSRIDKIIGIELAISQVSNTLAGSIDGGLVSFDLGCSADETLSERLLIQFLILPSIEDILSRSTVLLSMDVYLLTQQHKEEMIRDDFMLKGITVVDAKLHRPRGIIQLTMPTGAQLQSVDHGVHIHSPLIDDAIINLPEYRIFLS